MCENEFLCKTVWHDKELCMALSVVHRSKFTTSDISAVDGLGQVEEILKIPFDEINFIPMK